MDNQKAILDGMIDAVKETNDNLFVFTNHATRRENKESVQGAYQIMELPDFEYFDGQRTHLDQRSNWRVMLEATTVQGQSGNSAVHLVNNVPGRWWDPAVQSTPLVPNTDYVYTAYGKSNTQYV